MNPDIDKCFKILEVKRGASYKEVRNAYIDLMKVWHPDRFHGEPELREKAEFKVKEINHAHDVLKKYYQTKSKETKSENTGYSAYGQDKKDTTGTRRKEKAKNEENKYRNYQYGAKQEPNSTSHKRDQHTYQKKHSENKQTTNPSGSRFSLGTIIIVILVVIALIRFGMGHTRYYKNSKTAKTNNSSSYNFIPSTSKKQESNIDKYTFEEEKNELSILPPELDNIVTYHNQYSSDEKKLLKLFLFSYGYPINYENSVWDENVYSAVINFQKDQNLIADGKIGKSTLLKISEVISGYEELDLKDKKMLTNYIKELAYRSSQPKKVESKKYVHNTTISNPTNKSSIKVPQNASIVGNIWLCNSGYEQIGNRCEKIVAPANASIVGNIWLCNSGYQQIGNRCVKLEY